MRTIVLALLLVCTFTAGFPQDHQGQQDQDPQGHQDQDENGQVRPVPLPFPIPEDDPFNNQHGQDNQDHDNQGQDNQGENNQGPQEPVRLQECNEDEDCPVFGYCHYSYWIGEQCLSFMTVDASVEGVDCGVDNDQGERIPVHSICQDVEVEDSNNSLERQYTTSRCYPQLGYKCAKSYNMPCTPNYDASGNPIPGEEESCPESFECVSKNYKSEDQPSRVCVPVEPKERFANTCASSFDCGYSLLESAWTRCYSQNCARAVEK